MLTYLARVQHIGDWWAIDFPDLPGTHAQTEELAQVKSEAVECLKSFLLAAKAVSEEVSAPSAEIRLKPGQFSLPVTI